jgi:enoyl-CoA hydratase
MGEFVLQCEDAVATLTIENQPSNCITTTMFQQLREHVKMIEAREDIHVAVIRGGGSSLYTVGADIHEMEVQAQLDDRADATRAWLATIHEVFESIEHSPIPFICAMKGISYGGGIELAAACDIRIASQDVRIAMPEAKLGIIPGYGGTQRLVHLMGLGHTLTLVLGGQSIRADVAQQWGLVDMITPLREAESTAHDLALRIAEYGPLAVANAKRAIRYNALHDLTTGLVYEQDLFIECAISLDFDEGRQAFLEKRIPHFGGQRDARLSLKRG